MCHELLKRWLEHSLIMICVEIGNAVKSDPTSGHVTV